MMADDAELSTTVRRATALHEIGDEITARGQSYVLIGYQPHVRQNGRKTGLALRLATSSFATGHFCAAHRRRRRRIARRTSGTGP
jgi:hypothetical protein